MRNLFAAVVLAIVAPGLTPMSNAEPITFKDLFSRPRAAPTKTFSYGPSPRQVAELWLPAGEGPHRTLILIHGGCWLAALPGQEQSAYQAEDLRRHGYAVWNIDYRRIGDEGGGYPGTFLDTAAAIDKLSEVAPAHKLDLRKLIAVGHSAGGHLALWAAARKRIAKTSSFATAAPLPITGVVSLSGIIDLKEFRATGPSACGGPPTIDALVGARADPYADTSPPALLPLGVKQVIISATLDRIVPARFGQEYAKAAAASGDTVKEITIANAGHFELIDPTSAAWREISAEIDGLAK